MAIAALRLKKHVGDKVNPDEFVERIRWLGVDSEKIMNGESCKRAVSCVSSKEALDGIKSEKVLNSDNSKKVPTGDNKGCTLL